MPKLPGPPNGRLFEWIRFIAHLGVVLAIPVIGFFLGFARTVDQYMTRMDAKIESVVTREEFEARLSQKADIANVPPSEVKQSLAALRTDVNRLTDLFLSHLDSHPPRSGR